MTKPKPSPEGRALLVEGKDDGWHVHANPADGEQALAMLHAATQSLLHGALQHNDKEAEAVLSDLLEVFAKHRFSGPKPLLD